MVLLRAKTEIPIQCLDRAKAIERRRQGKVCVAIEYFSKGSKMSYPVVRAEMDYANVEIRDCWTGTGNYASADDATIVIYRGPASAAQEWPADEGHRLCARRESIPMVPTSPFGLWKCASGFEGIQVGEAVVTEF